jgi:ribosome-binding ATPase YchF (GTP1/OBG family)
VKNVEEYCGAHLSSKAVIVSAQIESELVDLPEAEGKEYLAGLGVKESGVGSLIRAAYDLLGLRTYLTTGPKETRAWTIHAGDRAPQAAGVIHTDFERGFIAAETVAYTDLQSAGTMAKVKEAGKLRVEGKEYVVQDGDVMDFRFNV